MTALATADRVEVLILVDNLTDNLSSAPAYVENEFSRLWRRGAKRLGGSCLCCAAHGLACAITAWRGGVSRTLLFDTGPDAAVFERNVDRLGFDHATVDAIALSHGHWDHCGALPRALEMIALATGGKRLPVYLHPDAHVTRALRGPDGAIRPFADIPSADEIDGLGGTVVHARHAQLVLDDLFHLSGEIPRVTPFEQGMPGQVRLAPDGGWEPDPLVVDERYVAVRVKDKGTIVFTACSHAGVVNVLNDARATLAGPLHGVLGGFHLAGANEIAIAPTVEAMKPFALASIAAGHCTGWRAIGALAAAFGEAVAPSSVGKTYRY